MVRHEPSTATIQPAAAATAAESRDSDDHATDSTIPTAKSDPAGDQAGHQPTDRLGTKNTIQLVMSIMFRGGW